MFENSSDQLINDLIERLCDKASSFTCKPDERQTLIDQIAQLRASQNPIITMEPAK